MKKLLSILLCILMLTACGQNDTADSSSQINPTLSDSVSSDSAETVLALEDAVQAAVADIVTGNLAIETWRDGARLDNEKYIRFFDYVVPSDYVSADVYETFMYETFGVTADVLRQHSKYSAGKKLYDLMGRYIHRNNDYKFCGYTADGDIIKVEYIIYSPMDIPRYRILTMQKTGSMLKYISNTIDTRYSYAPEVQPVNLKQENLLQHARALAEHLAEMKGGTYRLSDLKPENILWVIRTVFMFGYDDFSRGNNVEYYPYNTYLKYNGGDAVYTLKQAQIIAYQLFGFENWFVDDEIFDKEINRYIQPTELGFGFGPVAREISPVYISGDRIQVDISAENIESEEKYNFKVIFDIITENDCTFLRFNEMTMQKL